MAINLNYFKYMKCGSASIFMLAALSVILIDGTKGKEAFVYVHVSQFHSEGLASL